MKFKRALKEAPEKDLAAFKLPDNMLNNPSSINIKGMAAQAKADADRKAEAERQAKIFAQNKQQYASLIEEAKAGETPEDKLQILFDELVPNSGEADTVAGELVRAMMRLLYRDYNDGDLFYEGYGLETCSGSVAYLIDMFEDLEEDFESIALRNLEDDAYTKALDNICGKLCNYIFTNDSVWQENTEDSRSSRWEQIYKDRYSEWEPEYEYDFQIPPTIQDYIDAGHIIADEFIDQVRSAIEGNWSIKFDDIEDSWSGYINITGLNREGYDELQSWRMWEDSMWSDYIDELRDEYGDLDEDDDDEDFDFDDDDDASKDESLKPSRNYRVGQKVRHNGKETTIRKIEDSDEYGVDLLIDNPDFSPERYPGKDSWKFERIWVGTDVEPV